MRYCLEPLTLDEGLRWDHLTAPFESRQLFHRDAWLHYLAVSRKIVIRHWALRERQQIVGYFCGGIVKKGFFRILGSPLKGWGSNSMGPVATHDFSERDFLEAVDDLAARERFAMVEIETPLVSGAHLSDFGYHAVSQRTYLVTLAPGHPEKMWSSLTQRTQVRKAIRSGLIAEDTSDPAIADEFYDQFLDVMTRKKLHPPYARSCPRLLFSSLKPRDLLFAVRVRDPNGEVVATGLFPHDQHTMYFWGGASRLEGRAYSPNDLLHWTVMEMAAARGLRLYNMCGDGFFKSKFGGTLHMTRRWHKFYSRTARLARSAYELSFHQRLRLQRWWHQIASGRGDR
jgi:Acetyltransferase (GNAT) domain